MNEFTGTNLQKKAIRQPLRVSPLHRRVHSLGSNAKPTAAEVFLRSFVKALILQTSTYRTETARFQKARALQQARAPSLARLSSLALPEQTNYTKTGLPVVKPILSAYNVSPSLVKSPPLHAPHAYAPHTPPLAVPSSTPSALPQFGIGKIQAYLQNPTTRSIECPGPDRPLVLVRGGKPEVQQVTLSAEEINTFLQEVATQTKIPLLPGLYKALLGPFIITAVLSDVIGSRFIVQRR